MSPVGARRPHWLACSGFGKGCVAMPNKHTLTTAIDGAITSAGNSSSTPVQPVGNVGGIVEAVVSGPAVSGSASPTLNVSLQFSQDGSTWTPANSAETFAPITAAGIFTLAVPSRGQFVRAAWTVSGTTPSFTTAIALMSGM